MAGGKQFEYEFTKSLNECFKLHNCRAIAWRHFTYRMQEQLFDIFVDSPNPQLYMAVECKSLDYRKNKSLNFRSHFQHKENGHQITKENNFLWSSGRKGIVAVHLHNIPGEKTRAVIIPFSTVRDCFNNGEHSISLRDYTDYVNIVRYKQCYTIVIEDLLVMDMGFVEMKSLSGSPQRV